MHDKPDVAHRRGPLGEPVVRPHGLARTEADGGTVGVASAAAAVQGGVVGPRQASPNPPPGE